QQSDIKLATERYLQSKAAFEESAAHRDLIYVLAELGLVSIYAADYEKAESYSRQALALGESLKGVKEPPGELPDEYGVAFARSNLGNVAKWKGDYDQALDDFQQALPMWKDLARRGLGTMSYAVDSLEDAAHVYQALGDHRQALGYLNQALVLAQS